MVCVVIVLIVLGWYLNNSFKIATGYAAKYMCSQVFLAELDDDRAKQALNFFPVSNVNIKIDKKARTVTTNFFGLARQKAQYYKSGHWCGCALHGTPDLAVSPSEKSPELRRQSVADSTLKQVNGDNEDRVQRINGIIQDALSSTPQLLAVVVSDENNIIGEGYNEGISNATPLLGWSMTKSFNHTLFGILEQKGIVKWDDKVNLDPWANTDRSDLTLGQLLQMSSAIEWNENYSTWSDVTDMLYMSEDVSSDVTDDPLDSAPGSVWNYSSGTSNILSTYLRQICEDNNWDYHEFVKKEFLDKVGMSSAQIEMDATGLFIMSSYGWATAQDWNKFGQLYLNKGQINNEALFSSEWWKRAFEPAPKSGGLYGGHFWLNKTGVFPSVPNDAFYPNGFGGQRVLIIPSLGIVITTLSGHNPDFDFDGLYKEILDNLD